MKNMVKFGFNRLDNKTVKIAIITSIITAILTTLGSYLILQRQMSFIKQDNLISSQHLIFKDFTKTSTELELLREQAYWNKYFSVLEIKMHESVVKINPRLLINNFEYKSESVSDEKDIRFRYNEKISEMTALITIVPSYFKTINLDSLKELQISMGMGFGFDLDYMNKKYDDLFLQIKNSDTFADSLNILMEKKYDRVFYNKSVQILTQLKEELK